MKRILKKQSALLLAFCLLLGLLTVSPIGASATEKPEPLSLGTYYLKAEPKEYEYSYPYDYERDKGSYTYIPEQDGVLDAVIHDKEFYNLDSSWQFVITGDGLNTTLPAYVKKGETYTIEAKITDMRCLYSFCTCDEIHTGETKYIVIGENESLFFTPDKDMTVTYSSLYEPDEDDLSVYTVIKEDNRVLTDVQATKPDAHNFAFSFDAKAGHVYILKNYDHWKDYERNFGEFSVSLEEKRDFEIENNAVVKYTGNERTVQFPMSYANGAAAYGEAVKDGELLPSVIESPLNDSKYQQITELGESSFADSKQLEEVAIPSTVTKIGSNAFNNCPKLKAVTLSGGIEEIGSGAFCNCPSLLSADIPATVSAIGANALGYLRSGEGDLTKVEGFTIRGFKDSAAQQYAEKNGFNFVRVDDNLDIALPSRTSVKRINNGESVRFIYFASKDCEVTFLDSNSWSIDETPLTTASVVDSKGNEVAKSDDFAHSITGMPFHAKEGETYTITVNAVDGLTPVSEDDELFWYYEWQYYELREVTVAELEKDYTCFSEYASFDESDYFNETRYFKFTAPKDGELEVKDLGIHLVEDGGHYYFDVSDASKMSENTRLPVKVVKGHTYYIKSNYQMCTGEFQFILKSSGADDKGKGDKKDSGGSTTDSGNGSSGGSGTIQTGADTTLLMIAFCVMLAAIWVIYFAGRRKDEKR